MRATQEGVTIQILGKELMVACPADQREALVAAARLLDDKMREVQGGGKVMGSERCAIMAALNMSNELLELRRKQGGASTDVEARLRSLTGRVDAVLREATLA